MKSTDMWTCLVLLYAQLAVGVTADTVVWSKCPTNCTCTGSTAAVFVPELLVDCQRHTETDREQLLNQLDSLLSSNLTFDRFTSLSIVNSPLTYVPLSVCQMTTLTVLRLDSNRLTRLPACLTNLSNLSVLSARNNSIELLQEGVFDGLRRLQFLDLHRNRISAIGLSVFATASNLSSLFSIILSENYLTSLEPWLYDRGLVGSRENSVTINLTHNNISKYTNKLGYYGEYYNKTPFLYVDLRKNPTHHVLNVFKGWQLALAQLITWRKMTPKGTSNLLIIYDINTECDCVDYNYNKAFALQDNRALLPVTLKLLFCNSSIVNDYSMDLNLFVCKLTERCPAECVCVHRPANDTLHVYCSNRNLTVLPLELPELPDSRTKYKLDFSNNKLLRRLEHRDYFVNTSILDVRYSSVNHVSDWEGIVKIPIVSLFGNKITSLPPSVSSINISTRKLDLANNPWDCSCENKWMSGVFISMADRLTQEVLCYSPFRLRGRNITQVSDQDFCIEAASLSVTETLTIVTLLFVGVVIMLSVALIIYRLRVKLYTRFRFHPFDRDECLGEDMNYDVFLSCSSDDNLPHGNRIRELLEEHGYRACYPPRDFVAGELIYDNICNAVVRSKRTVCFLTENFCQRFVPPYHLF